LIGVNLEEPVAAGFEIRFDRESAHLGTAMGRTTIDFAQQCFGAAILAKLSGGEYTDPQNGLGCDALDAFGAAEVEVKNNLNSARPEELAKHQFPGWAALE
jgi:hypothetical protein